MVNKWMLTEFTFRIWAPIFSFKAAFKNTLLGPWKIKHKIALWFSNSNSGYIPQRIQSRYLNRHLYTHVHSGIIHNNQKVETTQMFIHTWVKNRILFTIKKVILAPANVTQSVELCLCTKRSLFWGEKGDICNTSTMKNHF